jgi:hypothetical protein
MDIQTVPLPVKRQAAGDVVPYSYSMHFAGMNFKSLMADPAKVLRFTTSVRERVSLAVNLPLGNVQVRGRGRAGGARGKGWGRRRRARRLAGRVGLLRPSARHTKRPLTNLPHPQIPLSPPFPPPKVTNLTEGSVIATVVLQTPSTWSATQVRYLGMAAAGVSAAQQRGFTPNLRPRPGRAPRCGLRSPIGAIPPTPLPHPRHFSRPQPRSQVNDAAATLAAPSDVFDAAFQKEWDITGVTVTLKSELPPRPTGLTKEATIGVGVGVGVGGALAIGGVAAYIVARKRRAAVEPRDRMV